jgi:hypothetical protein
MQLNVWFNSGVSLTAIMRAIREQEKLILGRSKLINKIFCTHKNPYFIGFPEADHAEAEPHLTGDAYVAWALEFSRQHEINRFVVGDHFQAITQAQAQFEAQGVQLVYGCPADKWNLIDDKSLFYSTLNEKGHGSMLPTWMVWNDSLADGLDCSIDWILSQITHADKVETPVCAKPVQGIFGQGFFRFRDTPNPEQQLFQPERKIIKSADFAALAHQAGLANGHRNWMVMEFLPGPEYSVDCLAWEGKLVSAVTREKQGGKGQVVVHDPVIQAYVQTLIDVFKLNGVFNAQFLRNSQGQPKVLEINPRFSGGTGMSVRAGVNLPWWWLKLTAGGRAEDVPQPELGLRVQALITHVPLQCFPSQTQG